MNRRSFLFQVVSWVLGALGLKGWAPPWVVGENLLFSRPTKLMSVMWASGEFAEDWMAAWIPAMEAAIARDHQLFVHHGNGLHTSVLSFDQPLVSCDPRLAAACYPERVPAMAWFESTRAQAVPSRGKAVPMAREGSLARRPSRPAAGSSSKRIVVNSPHPAAGRRRSPCLTRPRVAPRPRSSRFSSRC